MRTKLLVRVAQLYAPKLISRIADSWLWTTSWWAVCCGNGIYIEPGITIAKSNLPTLLDKGAQMNFQVQARNLVQGNLRVEIL